MTEPIDPVCPISSGAPTSTAPGGGLIIPFRNRNPKLGNDVFVAPGATVIGQATLGDRSSVWFGSVVRADIAPIEIGAETNIQDLTLIHVGDEFPCVIGQRVVVGHRVILHGCRVGNESMIGMGAILMNGAVVGSRSIIAAGSLVTEGTVIPPNSLVMGVPGKVVRTVTPEQVDLTIHLARKYAGVAQEYLERLGRG